MSDRKNCPTHSHYGIHIDNHPAEVKEKNYIIKSQQDSRCQRNYHPKNQHLRSYRPAILLACLLFSLILASCSATPPAASDGQNRQEGLTRIGNFMEIDTPKQLTLLDNKDTLAAEGLYYATWTAGSSVPYENSDSDTIDLYDAQLYLLASEADDKQSAEKNYETWLAAAENNYEVHSKDTITCSGQSYTLISYTCINENNPYDRGVSALGVRGAYAVCAELTCVEDYDKDLEELLREFLDGCHYSISG